LSSSQNESTLATLWKTLPLVGMLIVLLGGVYLFLTSVRNPSSDALFASIENAKSEGELALFGPQMNRFLAEYPDDPRADQIQEWQDQVELERTIRRLQARARVAGGMALLPPAPQAFLRAMEARQQSRSEAVEQLQAWLDVFDPVQTENDDRTTNDGVAAVKDREAGAEKKPELSSTEEETKASSAGQSELAPVAEYESDSLQVGLARRQRPKLVELARQELARLRDEPPPEEVDARLQLLEERLRRAETLPTSSRRRLLSGLIRLYQEQAWAEPIVRRAEQSIADD